MTKKQKAIEELLKLGDEEKIKDEMDGPGYYEKCTKHMKTDNLLYMFFRTYIDQYGRRWYSRDNHLEMIYIVQALLKEELGKELMKGKQ